MRSSSTSACAALIIALVAFTISSCNSRHDSAHESPTPPAAEFPNLTPLAANMRFHWSADPGIDLYKGPAVPIRAYLESFFLINLLANPDAGYPGFKRAVPYPPDGVFNIKRINNPAPRIDQSTSVIGPYLDKPLYGVDYLHILRITPIPDGFSTRVCVAEQGLYLVTPEKKYRPMFSGSELKPWVMRVDFSDQTPTTGPPAPASPTAPQRGPLPAPAEDVFGPWVATAGRPLPEWFTPDGKSGKDPETDALEQQCTTSMQTPGLQLPGPTFENPPPAPAPVPGWPALPE